MNPSVSKGARYALTVSLAVQGLYKNLWCRGGIWFIGRVVQPLLIAAEGGPASVQCNLSWPVHCLSRCLRGRQSCDFGSGPDIVHPCKSSTQGPDMTEALLP